MNQNTDIDTDTENPEQPTFGPTDQEILQVENHLQNKSQPQTTNHQPPTTTKGSPHSRAWDDAWKATVEDTENHLNRRICGARTHNGIPCELEPTHANGRCRFHGGFDLTGAPKGNRNAVLHGLYSRRLQICGAHCPQWENCPCAGDDVLELNPKKRPICPYELTEYNTILTDALAKCEQQPHPDPMDKHHAHDLALLHVMMTRAGNALNTQQLVEKSQTDAKQPQYKTIDPYLYAFLRLSAEYRALNASINKHFAAQAKHGEIETPTTNTILNHDTRQTNDTNLEPESQEKIHIQDTLLPDYAQRFVRKAMKAAAQGQDTVVLDTIGIAGILDDENADREADRVLAAYRPKGKILSPDAIKEAIKLIKNYFQHPTNPTNHSEA